MVVVDLSGKETLDKKALIESFGRLLENAMNKIYSNQEAKNQGLTEELDKIADILVKIQQINRG